MENEMTDIKEYIADGAKNIVDGARRGAYGKPENNFHRIAKLWNAWFDAKGWALVPTEVANNGDIIELAPGDISPMMRLMKEARLCETPDHLDSHMDIVGYALTGAEVAGVQVPPPPQKDITADTLRKENEKLYADLRQAATRIIELQRALAGQDVASSQAAEKEQDIS